MNCEDCRELVELLRGESNCDVLDCIDDAATAIETLLAERDAALDELHGICWCCANGKPMGNTSPLGNITSCEHLAERGTLGCAGRVKECQYWQWRGPRKEVHHDI